MSKLKINRNKEKIVKLLNENIDLEYNLRLKLYHRFSEENRDLGTKKKPQFYKIKIGHWFECFKDEDTDEKIKIERNEIIEIDGVKSNHWNRLTYYTVADV